MLRLSLNTEQDNIPEVIVKAIFDNKRQNKRETLHYSEIHRKVEGLLGHPISDRQLLKNLSELVHQKLLNRYDPTMKRGARVNFSLTDKCEMKYRLGIIGANNEVKKRESLYLLLIFFEAYKRRPLLTETQLARFLKQIGSSMNDLKKVQQANISDKSFKIIFKPINGVQIVGFTQYNHKVQLNKTRYYTVIPGFSVDEFIFYLRLLKTGMEPRPFGERTVVPFVSYMSYTKREVVQVIDLLKEVGLIKPIQAIIPGETRFNIADDSSKHLIYDIWLIRLFDSEMLNRKLTHGKPSPEDQKYLELFLGRVDLMVSLAHDFRREHRKEKGVIERSIKGIGQRRTWLVNEVIRKYQAVINENEALFELVKGICRPFPELTASQN